MGITIDKLIVFCENLEEYHSTLCKRYDDASGYTRSRIEEIRTNDAKREEMDSKFYHELKKIMRKYQKIREIAFPLQFCSTDKLEHETIMKICEVLEDGNVG